MADIKNSKVGFFAHTVPRVHLVFADTACPMLDTLIVWTEPNQTDMALSFQEAEGCAVIW